MRKNVKLLSLLLTLFMILPMVAPTVVLDTAAEAPVPEVASGLVPWDGTVATAFAGGAGTESSPYQIANGAQLAYFAYLMNTESTSNTYATKYYVLTSDIDLGNKEWTPIGGRSYHAINGVSFRFGGKFDGQGHTICNFCVAEEKQSVGSGLFGILKAGAEIKNLTLIGKITAGAKYDTTNAIGGSGMLAVASYGAKITNVDIYVNMYIRSSGDTSPYIGGMFGYSCDNTVVTDCNLYGSLTVKHSDALITLGGLVGRSRRMTVTNVTCDVDINILDGGANSYVGGLIGETDSNETTTDVITLTGCRYTGDISAYFGRPSNCHIGGLIGYAGKGGENVITHGIVNISDCFHDGSITVAQETANVGTIRVGSMIGFFTPNIGTVKNFYTSSTLPLYNLDPNGVYGDGGMTLNDQGGHITGIGIASEYGVSLRLTGGSTGLRYNSAIKRELYDTLMAHANLSFKLGTLITPTSYVEGAGGFTKELLRTYADSKSYANAYVDVNFDPAVNGWLDTYYNDETSHVFSGAISNLKDASYNLAFSGVGYVELTSGGYTHTFYGDYTDSARSRTAAYIAEKARADRQDVQDEKYQYLTEDGDYSPYTANQRDYIEAFYAKLINGAMNTTDIKLFENGKSDYAIVYPLGAIGAERDMAVYLQQAIYNITGKMLPVREKCATNASTPYEIVVGYSEYASAYKLQAFVPENGYTVITAGQRIVILGATEQALATAIRAFVAEAFDTDLATTLSLTPDTNASVSVSRFLHLEEKDVTATPLNVDLSGYKLAYHSDNEIEKRMAYSFQQRYLEATGITLNMSTATTYGKRILFVTDTSYKNGDFSVATTEGGVSGGVSIITVTAGSYYGFEGAEDYMISEALYGLAPLTTAGFSMSGNYKYWVSGYEKATQYAYTKMGDVRVMYYNVLFGNSTGTRKDENDKNIQDVPIPERNRLETQMIAQYMPDVLGCQEFNWGKRGGAGDYDLTKLLASLGYAETIDPRVDNASNPLWGNSGAYEVTVDGVTFKTYYNNTPLFYNTKTTEYVEGAYYWYKNQWDIEGTHGEHPNSAGDCGSKAATWGLFRDIKTGHEYIVITTHMCTRSNYIRGLQAQEMVELIATLKETYNVPIFLGGDLNGNSAGENYRLFVSDEVGYTDLNSSEIATIFSSELRTAHGYPLYDNAIGMMQPGADKESTQYSADSIDRILITNDTNRVQINIFAVISDDMTRSASDHYPIMTDFRFISDDYYDGGHYTERY